MESSITSRRDLTSPIPSDTRLAKLHEEILRLCGRASAHGQRLQNAALSQGSLSFVAVQDLLAAAEMLHVTETELTAQSMALAESGAVLEEERRRYQELFDFAPDAYLVTDLRGRILEANRAVSTLLSTPRSYVVGKPLSAFVSRQNAGLLQSQLDRIVHTSKGTVRRFELHLRARRYGPEATVSIRAAPICNHEGAVEGIRWMLRDVTTQQKQAVARREREQTQSAELHARVMELDALVRMKDASLAHDGARHQELLKRIAAALSASIDAGKADAEALAPTLKLLRDGMAQAG